MNNPNEYVGFSLAQDYIDDRLQYENNRNLLKQTRRKRPGRVYCTICHSLVEIGHVLIVVGRRLERFDRGLKQPTT
ncbi:MAG: hypothetical protein ACWGN2_02395 [Anaerolineales bacterium]